MIENDKNKKEIQKFDVGSTLDVNTSLKEKKFLAEETYLFVKVQNQALKYVDISTIVDI